jgi:hypothetical protein
MQMQPPASFPASQAGLSTRKAFSTSRPNLSISPTSSFTSVPSVLSSGDNGCTSVDGTPEVLAVFGRGAPQPCVLPLCKNWFVRWEYESICHATVRPTTAPTICGLHVAANHRNASQGSEVHTIRLCKVRCHPRETFSPECRIAILRCIQTLDASTGRFLAVLVSKVRELDLDMRMWLNVQHAAQRSCSPSSATPSLCILPQTKVWKCTPRMMQDKFPLLPCTNTGSHISESDVSACELSRENFIP